MWTFTLGNFLPLNIYKDFGFKYAHGFFESKYACHKKQMCIVYTQNQIKSSGKHFFLLRVISGNVSPLNIDKDFGFKYAHGFFESKYACHKKQMCIVDTQNQK